MQVNHIGYIVKDIDKSFDEFKNLGYEKSSTLFTDEKRHIKIQFIKNGDYEIELIEAMDEESDAYAYFKKYRNGPYHMCYDTADIEVEIKKLEERGYKLLKGEENAIAFSNRKVAFLYHNNVGLIEIVENI